MVAGKSCRKLHVSVLTYENEMHILIRLHQGMDCTCQHRKAGYTILQLEANVFLYKD